MQTLSYFSMFFKIFYFGISVKKRSTCFNTNRFKYKCIYDNSKQNELF